MPMMDGLKVIRSRIHGYGVEATRRFRVGEIILYGDGVLYHEDEEFDDSYALILPAYGAEDADDADDKNLYWDLTCQSRWINHSCDPNTEVDSDWIAEENSVRAWWTALRDIEPGEELSYDYAFAAHLAELCTCGSPRCRGLIVDPDEAHLVPDSLRHLLRTRSSAKAAAR